MTKYDAFADHLVDHLGPRYALRFWLTVAVALEAICLLVLLLLVQR